MNFFVADLTRERPAATVSSEQEFPVIESQWQEERGVICSFDEILRISWFPGISYETNRKINKIGKSE